MPTLITWSVVTRTNTSIPFYELTPEEKLHLETKYINPGILHSYEEITSEDGLSEQRVFRWYINNHDDSDLIHAYIQTDDALKAIEQNAAQHNAANGIVRSPLTWQIRDDDGNMLGEDQLFQEDIFRGN
jgi:hypothetical protein